MKCQDFRAHLDRLDSRDYQVNANLRSCTFCLIKVHRDCQESRVVPAKMDSLEKLAILGHRGNLVPKVNRDRVARTVTRAEMADA